jgi:hypothetical protein
MRNIIKNILKESKLNKLIDVVVDDLVNRTKITKEKPTWTGRVVCHIKLPISEPTFEDGYLNNSINRNIPDLKMLIYTTYGINDSRVLEIIISKYRGKLHDNIYWLKDQDEID